jgi:hypothetical protein
MAREDDGGLFPFALPEKQLQECAPPIGVE